MNKDEQEYAQEFILKLQEKHTEISSLKSKLVKHTLQESQDQERI